MWNPFRKPEPVNPGKALAELGRAKRRAIIHARADEMRAAMNLPPVQWPGHQ